MALKDQVLAALEAVRSPDGTPLPKTGALSEVVASDGKVFFSISVDAGAVNAWEPVRKRVEEVFGWMKTTGLLRKLRHRGGPLIEWIFTFTAAAYNLVRLRTLLTAAA